MDDSPTTARPAGITMAEVFSPMLEPTSLEATISECSLEVKPSDIFTRKLKERLLSCCYIMLIMFIPIVIFVLVLEYRRLMLTDPEPYIANGTFHLAHTSCGPVQGMALDGGFEFLGIPYAIPPVSHRKSKGAPDDVDYTWMPGTPPFRLEHCWKDVLKYPKSKPQDCLQMRPSSKGHYETYGSQDCLTLDVYTPIIGYDTPSPVVVVIAIPTLYGGWSDQAHQDQATPSAALAKEKGVVFVVPRFRLGPMGFLPRLLLNDTSSVIKDSTSFQDSVLQAQKTQLKLEKSYNLGLTDLFASLIWISSNIEHFGGDPSLVTLLGWGAGADLVNSLTTSKHPEKHPYLFTQAWVTHGHLTQVENEVQGDASQNRTGSVFKAGYNLWSNSPCNSKNSSYDPLCLISLPPRKIFESVPHEWLKPSGHTWLEPDSFVYRQSAKAVWSKGHPPYDFPLVLGSTVHGDADTLSDCETIETQVASEIATFRHSAESAKSAETSESGESAENMIIPDNSTDVQENLARLSTTQLTCPLWNLAQKADQSFNSGVFFYLVSFEETVPCRDGTRLRLAGGLSDISAILGRYRHTDKASIRFASHFQDVFYDFVVDGTLPGKVRASQGLYDFGEIMQMRTSYPQCAAVRQ